MDETTFIARFPTTPNQALAAELGVSVQTVIHRARRLGLQKDKGYLHGLRHGIGAMAIPTMRERGTIRTGERHYNWKGGRPWVRFSRPEYIAWRNAVLERDAYVCQSCFRQCKKHERGLAAHHIKPYVSHPDLRYDVSNGKTLCRECHMRLHGKPFQVQMIACACGCGTMIPSKDRYGRPRGRVNHHGKGVLKRTKKLPRDDGTLIPCACGCGQMIHRIGSRSQPIRFAPGHVTRERMAREGVREETRYKISEARKRDVQERQRNERGQFA